jgi:dipeptidyl aminopeptidase/acylaminoacyl peptidase
MVNSVLILASVLWTQAPSHLAAVAPSALASKPAVVQSQGLRALDHSVYDQWKSIRGTTISNDGNWIAYAIAAQEGDMVLEVQNTSTGAKFSAPIGQSLTLPQGTPVNPRITISGDSKFLVATVNPKWEEYKKARKDKVKPADLPKNGMLVVDLTKSEGKVMEKVSSWQMAPEDQGYLLYKPEVAPTPPAAPTKDEPAKEEAKKDTPKKKADHKPGETYTLRELATGEETKWENVVSAVFSKNGDKLALSISTKDGLDDGIAVVDLKSGAKTDIVKGLGRYLRMAFDEDSNQVAFVTDKDDYAAKQATNSLYLATIGKAPKLVAKLGSKELPKETMPAAGALSFSKSGKRLRFGVTAKPTPDMEVNADEAVALDVWHYNDERLQTVQLNQLAADRARSFDFLYSIGNDKLIELENDAFSSTAFSTEFDNDLGLSISNKAYRKQSSWSTGTQDIYTINLKTGERKELVKGTDASLVLSPKGKYGVGFEESTKKLVSYDLSTGKKVVLNEDLPPIWDELNDVPAPAGQIGFAGWTKDEARILVYDAFDIWAVDPSGKAKPECVTGGFGRMRSLRFRRLGLDPDEVYVDLSKPMLLSAVDTDSLDAGYYKLEPGKAPEKILMDAAQFGGAAGLRGVVQSSLSKAKNSDKVFFTRQTFREFPDLMVADSPWTFANRKRITDANPQQKEYSWGNAEHITYRSNDGDELKGILYTPDNVDYIKKHPMIVYFYERDSELLHSYRTPAPSASTINIPLFVSQGYVVLVPDIKYKTGYPGESAVNSILPATHEVLRRGFVDPKRVGIQGQSWGGYQVAYLVTETDMFAAGCAGAPVSNMLSAYGGIRGESGVVRQGQYEFGQSRIGESIWESPLRYLENSPLIHADKVKTPLLMMANDKDGAVPWQQGIEYFTALRRLDKRAWMLNYNGEAHNLVERRNRKDFSVRLSQFFDYYLNSGPLPVWMAEGIPAVKKGRTMGTEPTGEKKSGG